VAGRGDRDVGRLVAAERAARAASESAVRWWRDIAGTAESARTDQALDDLFRTALATIKSALGADAVSVLQANEAGDELVARASSGLSEEITRGLGIRIGEGMSGRVLATREPLIVDDLSSIAVVSPVLKNSGLRSVVAVPILLEDRMLGVLYAGSRELRYFSVADSELLELIAARWAGALERVQAFESERAAREQAERDASYLVRLQRITSKLLTATTTDEIAATLTESLATDAFGVDVAWSSVWLVRDKNLVLVPTPRSLPMSQSHTEIPLDDEGPVASTARDRCATYSLTDDSEGRSLLPEDSGLLHTSWAVLPLLVRQECIGVVVVAHRQIHNFEQEERDFLSAMADQAAQAIERARLYAAQIALAESNAFFAQAARVIAEGTDYADTLARLASLALHVMGDLCLIDVVGEDGNPTRMIAQHRDQARQHLADALVHEFPPDPLGHHPAIEVIHGGKTRWSEEMSDTFLRETTRDAAHYAVVKELDFRSYIAVPLTGETEVLGSLTVVSTTRPFGPVDVSFAERLAEHVAAVVDNARRYEATLQTSQTLQESLLPQNLRQIPGLQVATRYLPATRGLEVGGDFYDLIVVQSGATVLMIGDVAGHDREAAALMGQLRSAARALAGQVREPSELIALLQRSWKILDFDRMATALFGWLEPATGDLVVASAGHYPPLLIGPGRDAQYIPVVPSGPLGTTATKQEAVDWRGRLEPGQTLLLFTDGVIDEREIGAETSMERLADVASDGELSPAAICDRLVRMLPEDRIDDAAMMALQIES
jgi:GAF domain-containing protein